MSVGTIFFSYSRDNTEFVMNLAKELREAGADVWLDQLDIQPGSRWDKSIENALVKSQTLLVILSKSSVESNNVMDEVSFALEEGKSIVPVLLEDCDIPFRLRRLQFADFSKDHTKGIKSLINALHLKQSIALKLTSEELDISVKTIPNTQSSKPLKKDKKADPSSIELPPSDEVAKLKKSKNKILFTLFFVIVAIGVFFAWLITKPTPDEANWQKIKKSNKINLYDAHLLTFIECTHKRQAIAKINDLKNAQADRLDWEKIKNSTSFEDFDRHIEAYPSSKYNNLAKVKLKQLTAIAKEKADLNNAIKQNNPEAIKKYLKTYPSGMFQKEADSVLNSINTTNLNKIEIADWNAILRRNSINAYKGYLQKYPKGIYINQANIRINRIRSNDDFRRDVADWKKIYSQNSSTYYFKNHLRIFKNCIHKAMANDKIKRIDAEVKYYKIVMSRPSTRSYYRYLEKYGKTAIYYKHAKAQIYTLSVKRGAVGWVYLGRVTADGKRLSLKNFNKYLGDATALPIKGDLEQCIYDKSFIYLNTETKTKTNKKIKKSEVVVVLDIYYKKITSKKITECWIKVAKM